jgi:uncharacterized protein YyaL (SSP411 family)
MEIFCMKRVSVRLLIVLIVFSLLVVSCGSRQESAPESAPDTAPIATLSGENPNRLTHESSPYLLDHADNPVDWYPWGEEAFEKARQENKLIFLSIGYSACHWCHVMEAEVFSDPEVAALMNETFVNILVDREERPDIDGQYQRMARFLNGTSGWPLNIIMTPDGDPFLAANYIPKETRFDLMGMMELIPKLQYAWENDARRIATIAEQTALAFEETSGGASAAKLDASTLDAAFSQLDTAFDDQNGGFSPAPKFPMPHRLMFLLRYWQRTADDRALAMVESTLEQMRQGGVYDQVGFGVHRYATDEQWRVPHFEKMLYDQALLAMAYTEAYQATGKREYEQTAREIFDYVLRVLATDEGAFYAAEDADSEGVEGAFYLWTLDEIAQVLSPEEVRLATAVYTLDETGNFPDQDAGDGENILYQTTSYEDLASDLDMSEEALRAQMETIRQKLFAARETRVHPAVDDSIFTDWNGLMIAALAKGAQAFDEPRYAQAASDAADFLLAAMRDDDGRLLHRYRDGEASIRATADDYAFLIWGLLDLYEATFDADYLQSAITLNEVFIEHFWDGEDGGFFLTADDADTGDVLTRQKLFEDDRLPSANSAAMLNLLRLGRLTGNSAWEEKANALSQAAAADVDANPGGYTHLLSALDFALGPTYEVVIVGEPDREDAQALIEALRRPFLPNMVTILRPPDDDAPILQIADFAKGYYALDGEATAYVCQNYLCELPTTDAEVMLALLAGREDDGATR